MHPPFSKMRRLMGATLFAIVILSLTEYQRSTREFSTRITISPVDVYRRLTFQYAPDIFDQAAPSVVYINTFTVETLGSFFSQSQEVIQGQGSGIVWDDKGHIVTNYHVISTASTANVTISIPNHNKTTEGLDAISYTRRDFTASIIGVDPDKDIAVLKIDAPSSLLQPITIGKLAGHRIGEPAYAIGHPFGLDHSMTAGVISGLAREITSPNGRPIQNVIQTDADINPGNSGGPLLDGYGALIGINSVAATMSGDSAGVGFAVPVDDVGVSVTEIIATGKVAHAALGIATMDSSKAKFFGINEGVLVMKVGKESPSFGAGLKGTVFSFRGYIEEMGDIIVKMNEYDVKSDRDLFLALAKHKPGDEVTLTVDRAVSIVGNNVRYQKVTIATILIESGSVAID